MWPCEVAVRREPLAQACSQLADLYANTAHIVEFGLLESSDRQIWEFAKTNNYVIVTTDSDFYELAMTVGPPPKVIWLRRWVHPTKDAERVLRRQAIRISEFASDPELAVLVLDHE